MQNNFKVHFIGIGGIGVSALASYYLRAGWHVSGSDLASSEITGQLAKKGADIIIGKQSLGKNIPDLVIYSPAVPADNPGLKEARKLGIKIMSYPEALGDLTKKFETIAVAGAHGKSTVTAMIGLILAKAGFDPTVIVGTKVREFGNSNFRFGLSKYLVIEACEFSKSFLNYWPKMIVLTNIEEDHLECYDNLKNLTAAFSEFIGHLPQNGALVINADDVNTMKMGVSKMFKIPAKFKKYSLNQPDAAKIHKIMKVPGEHNVANALAALQAARLLKIPDRLSLAVLGDYKGSWRRFEVEKGLIGAKSVTVVSDYGHHPTQIKMTLNGAREKWPNKKIICVFQPHQALRTNLLFDDFVRVLRDAPVDEMIVADIYLVAGREKSAIVKKTSSKKMVAAVGKDSVVYIPTKDIISRLKREVRGGEIVIIMGAGDIYNLSKKITNLSKKK